jgi:hypothetical protein
MAGSFICPGSIALILISGIASSNAHSPIGTLSAKDISQTVKGKVCTTGAGAKFTFGVDGQYSYEGLWSNAGRYFIKDGAINVVLDSGLERSFVISRKGNVFYMEQTSISCG